VLESVEGIGPKRAAALMKAYVTVAALAAAEPEEMAERCGISAAAARAVRAAARLAEENRAGFRSGSRGGYNRSAARAASLAAEAAVAEAAADYSGAEGDRNSGRSF
jgi:excinuclease ABC subunit C